MFRLQTLSFCAVVVTTSAVVQGQTRWSRLPLLSNRTGHGLAFDSARRVLVLYGGANDVTGEAGDTWERDGSEWTERQSSYRPTPRAFHAMVFDAARQRVVLFGTGDPRVAPLAGELWEWDGTDWRLAAVPMPGPITGLYPGVAYDELRGLVVLFDGLSQGTWEWDGSTLTPRTPPQRPTARGLFAMTWDPVLRRSLLFGGATSSTNLQDTWTWDGTTWAQLAPATSPPGRVYSALAADPLRGRVLLHGGAVLSGFDRTLLGDSWEWDGTTWRAVSGTGPGTRAQHAAAFDPIRRRIVLVGGARAEGGGRSDLWEWDGAVWTRRSSGSPPRRSQAGLAFDSGRGRSVLFGGTSADTWEFDGSAWSEIATPLAPPARVEHAMAFDEMRGRTLLFGGFASNQFVRDDGWVFDGTTWTPVSPVPRPSPRRGHALAFDGRRGRVMLFAGRDLQQRLGDTWQFDGSRWQQAVTAAAPPARSGHGLAFDSRRSVVVLFGGSDGSSALGDTWEWDGTRWQQLVPPHAPSPRSGHAMVYDQARGRVVVSGGRGSGYEANTWEWDGSDWLLRSPLDLLMLRSGAAATFDGVRQRVVLFGGDSVGDVSDTLDYGPVAPASFAVFGAGCPGRAGVPTMTTILPGLPWIGTGFTLRLSRLPPSAPVMLWLGTSRTTWGSTALPFDLSAVGMPGCFLRVRPSMSLPLDSGSGAITVILGVPDDPALVGAGFWQQAFAAEASANALGVVASDAGEARFGAR